MKILVWNLQTFGVNKINNPSTAMGKTRVDSTISKPRMRAAGSFTERCSTPSRM
jgi:hypothetical protein